MTVRIHHLADLHLDKQFRDLPDVPEPVKEALCNASLDALERAVDLALALKAQGRLDAVTFGGW